jgi:hypothetical protein
VVERLAMVPESALMLSRARKIKKARQKIKKARTLQVCVRTTPSKRLRGRGGPNGGICEKEWKKFRHPKLLAGGEWLGAGGESERGFTLKTL